MTQIFWFVQKEFLLWFNGLLECFLYQSNISATEDTNVEDPCVKLKVFYNIFDRERILNDVPVLSFL